MSPGPSWGEWCGLWVPRGCVLWSPGPSEGWVAWFPETLDPSGGWVMWSPGFLGPSKEWVMWSPGPYSGRVVLAPGSLQGVGGIASWVSECVVWSPGPSGVCGVVPWPLLGMSAVVPGSPGPSGVCRVVPWPLLGLSGVVPLG